MRTIDAWIKYLERTRSSFTKNSYINNIKTFSTVISKSLDTEEDLKCISSTDVYNFVDHSSLSPQTMLAILSALKHYLKFSYRRNILSEDIYNDILKAIDEVREDLNMKKQKYPPKALLESEIEKILKAVKNTKYYKIYNLFLNSGIRLIEFERLKPDNFFLDKSNILWIRLDANMTKRNKPRITPIISFNKEKTIEIGLQIYEWTKDFDENFKVKRGVLQVYTDRLSKRLNISFSIHSFRHTYITNLVNYGFSAEIVKEFVGHSDIKTTIDTYYKFSQKRAQDLVNKLFGNN
ncbi:tyrosine-type recombinase/integrase [Hydrogenobaculum acidophilum]